MQFIDQHKSAITALAAATAAYVTINKLHAFWLDMVAKKTLLVDKASKTLAVTQRMFSGLWNSLKLGAAALTNGFLYLKNGLEVTYGMQERWRKSMQAMSFPSWTGLVLALGAAVYLLYQRHKELEAEIKIVDGIRNDAIRKMGEEKSKIELLIAAAKNETLSLEEREKAIVKLNSIIPNYNAHLDATKGKYVENKVALDAYLKSLSRQYELEGAKDKLAAIGREKAEATLALNDAQTYYDQINNQSNNISGYTYTTSWGSVGNTNEDLADHAKKRLEAAKNQMDRIETKENRILSVYGTDLQKEAANNSENSITSEIDVNTRGSSPSYPNSPSTHSGKSDDRFAEEKAWRARMEAEARIEYAKGEVSHAEHTERMLDIEASYHSKLLSRDDLTADERLKIRANYWEVDNKRTVAYTKQLEDEENDYYNRTVYNLNDAFRQQLETGNLSAQQRENAEKVHRESIELAELEHLSRLVNLYEDGTDEKFKAQQAYQQASLNAQKRHQQEYERQEAEFAKIKADVFGDNPQEQKANYDAELAKLQTVRDRELAAAGDDPSEKLRIEEAFQQGRLALAKKYNQEISDDSTDSYTAAVSKVGDWLNGEGGQALKGTLSFVANDVGALFSGISSLLQAELQLQTAQIENKYSKEVSLAQGNSYKLAKLEAQKEKDIAKAKKEANKKMFTMQVIQAVAQSALAGLNAYSSTLAIPIVGPALAPAAMALALATGAIQIAALKKQQQAAEAQGYSKGGFTKPGGVDEPAGVVHAGEWVASQKLLASPVARPMIDALDYVQRTNTIGSLREEDVSRAITANNSLVRIAENNDGSLVMAAVASRMSGAVDRLTDRLNEPFFTVNTVTGDAGIRAAQEEYLRLKNNKSPKNKRNGSDY